MYINNTNNNDIQENLLGNKATKNSDQSCLNFFNIQTPLSNKKQTRDLNLIKEKVDALSWRHVVIMFFVTAFIILQNTFAVLEIGRTFFPKKFRIDIVIPWLILGALSSLIQTLYARAWKIVDFRRHVSWEEGIILQHLENFLIKHLDKKNILLLIDKNLEESITDPKSDFNYTLNIFQKTHGASITISKMKPENKQLLIIDHFRLTAQGDNAVQPPFSLRHYILSDNYRRRIADTQGTLSTLSLHISQYLFLGPLFSDFLIQWLPVFVNTLQGSVQLASIFNIDTKSPRPIVLFAYFFGAIMGAIRGYVTKRMKAELAEARLAELAHHIGKGDLFNQSSESFFSEKCCLALKQALFLGFGILTALGTAISYAGIGLFFSKAGLIDWLNIIQISHPSPPGLLIFTAFSCLSSVLLNAVFNQGYDIVVKYWKDAKRLGKSTEEAPRDEYSAGFLRFILTAALFIDSINAGAVAALGAIKMAHILKVKGDAVLSLAIIIGVSIVISQLRYSTAMGKEEEKLWGKLYERTSKHLTMFRSSEKTDINHVKTPHFEQNVV